jgi:hypothetical protein
MIRAEHKKVLWDDAARKVLIQEVLQKGFIRLEHFFDGTSEPRFLALREVFGPLVKNIKNQQLGETFANEVWKSDEIFEMCQLIHTTRCELTGVPCKPLVREKQSVGIAYKDAATAAKNKETEFHYDAAYINIVIPVQLPSQGQGDGNLIAFPNLRTKYPRFIAAPLSAMLRRIPFTRTLYGYTSVDYHVGALHLFFGDVSLHGVPPIQKGERMIMTINSHW